MIGDSPSLPVEAQVGMPSELKQKGIKMDINGENLIDIIVNRLKDEGSGHRLYDSAIANKLRGMSSVELNQAINFGDVQIWHNERVLKQKEASQNSA